MKPRNRFDVQVVFPDIAFGIKNRADVELTPEQVADELEEFCARIRNGGKMPEGGGLMTAEEFERAYAARSRRTLEQLRVYRTVRPCDCGKAICEGW